MENDLKPLLKQMLATIDLMSDELAELVDQYHRPHLANDSQHLAVAKAQAVLDSAKQLRLIGETFLGIQDQQTDTEHSK
jgi:hypothetical protein